MTDTQVVLTVSGLIVGVAFQTFAIIKYLLSIANTGDRELHRRINRVRDEYVKRTELDRDLQTISRNVADIRDDLRQATTDIREAQREHAERISKRFDSMVGRFIKDLKPENE